MYENELFDPKDIPNELKQYFEEVQVECGAAWVRVTERVQFGKAASNTAYTDDAYKPSRLAGSRQAYRAMGLEGPPAPVTVGFEPSCSCSNQGTARSIVLDCFAGAGTSLLMAQKLGRDYLGIELSPQYCELIKRRVQPSIWETEEIA